MPNMMTDLVIDRVDLVEEGCNSAAFIRLYKSRGEKMSYESILKSLKPEHAEVIEAEMAKAKEALDTANQTITEKSAEIEDLAKKLEEAENKEDETAKATSFDETEVIKAMPEQAQQLFAKMRAQKEAAEEELRKSKEAEAEADAINKANALKSLPVEQSALVAFIKENPNTFDMLSSIAAAIDGAVFNEVGKSREGEQFENTADGAWGEIEKEAKAIAEAENMTQQAAIAAVIKRKPELYQKYLEGGAN